MISCQSNPSNFSSEKTYIPSNLLLQWHITERCNLHCSHCYQEKISKDELSFEELLNILEQFKLLLQQIKSNNGYSRKYGHITITGGEPFIREDFMDLLEILAIHRPFFSFAVLTNGSFLDPDTVHRLRRLQPAFVQVSIEGTQTTHDRIRGSGDFNRTVYAIKNLVRERIRTLIAFTAHRDNYREFPAVAQLGRQLGVFRVWADRLIPLGNGTDLLDKILTPEETREFFEIMHQTQSPTWRHSFNCTEIAMHRALQFLVGGGKPYHCTAGDSLIAVQSNGDVYPCRRMPIRVGNVLEAPLIDLYYQSELFRDLRNRNRINPGCQSCFYSQLCRGGLRCLSHAVYRDPFQADPGCWRAVRHNPAAIPAPALDKPEPYIES